jgi:hypothetical protein
MFFRAIGSGVVLSALTLSLLCGCRYDPSRFESELGLSASCPPFHEFFDAVEQHVADEILKFRSTLDQRPSKIKNKELSALLMAARRDAWSCMDEDRDSYIAEHQNNESAPLVLKLVEMDSVVSIYEISGKPWDDADIDLLLKGLSGIKIKAEMSWMLEEPGS